MADEKSEKKKRIEEQKKKEAQAKYVCEICESIFDDPGMCPNCDTVLKKKGG